MTLNYCCSTEAGSFVSDGSRIFRDLVVSVQRLLRVLLLQLSAQDTFRRRSQRVEEGRRERHDAPDGDDEEEAEVAVGLLDPLAHGGHQQVVDDVGGEEEGVDGAAVPEKLMKYFLLLISNSIASLSVTGPCS